MGTPLAVVVFLIVSMIVFGALRPIARRHRRLPPAIRTGAAALVGHRAMVLERIANGEGVGCVKVDNGEVWTARSYDEDEVIDVGERVEVVEIRGATAPGNALKGTRNGHSDRPHRRCSSSCSWWPRGQSA